MVKIKDIAKRANVSSATVSRILRNDPLLSVRENTRKEVLAIAHEMGYQRKTKKSGVNREIGIIQWISKYEEEVDPYYYELRKAVETQINLKGFSVHRFYKEDMNAVFEDYKLSGLVCVGKFSIKQAVRFKSAVRNVIFVDSNPDGERFTSVVFDFEQATENMLNYLVSLGHRRIGLIGGREYIGPEREPYIDKREKAFIDYMTTHSNVDFHKEDVYIRDFSAETGYQSVVEALKKETYPTAFFCESDTIAMGALRAVGEANLRGNQSISVTGFNDISTAKYLNPALTTIRLDVRAMSEVAADLLSGMIESSEHVPLKASLSTKLIIRDSVNAID